MIGNNLVPKVGYILQGILAYILLIMINSLSSPKLFTHWCELETLNEISII
jgi:hypothetical protein